MEVYERMLSGTNEKGMKIRKDRIFQVVAETSGIKAFSESANSTTSATLQLAPEREMAYQVAVNSNEKRMETIIRCLFPKASLK